MILQPIRGAAGMMSAPHPFPNATLLPNRKVLVIGGRTADVYSSTPLGALVVQPVPTLGTFGLVLLSLLMSRSRLSAESASDQELTGRAVADRNLPAPRRLARGAASPT